MRGRDIMPEVPKILHFITTAKSQTAETASRIKRWITCNPGWKAFVWCEPSSLGSNHAVASAQDPNVELKTIDPNTVPGAQPNLAASSDVLRYQILAKHGGCYLDSDEEPGDPLPSLAVSPYAALFAPAIPGKPRDRAIACVVGSHRIQMCVAQKGAQSCTMAAG